MSLLGIVYRKELRETLRDRRTLAVMILLPLVLYPVMSVLAAEWFISHEMSRQARQSKVTVAGEGAHLLEPALIKATAPARTGAAGDGEAAEAPALMQVTRVDNLTIDRKQGGRVLAELGTDAIVFVGAPAPGVAESERSLPVEIVYDPTSDASSLAEERISDALEHWADAEVARRLEDEKLAPGFVRPIELARASLASRGKVGRTEIAKTIPFMIVLMVLMGAFYPAIDLTAGEKERGTLEPLLATPAPRRTVMAGKLLTVATISALTGLLNLLCMAGAALWIARSAARSQHVSLPFGQLFSSAPWGAIGLSLVALAAATLLFSGLMMAVASLARGFKEAQSLLTPVYLVATMPAMVSLMPGTELSYGAALVPIANVALLLKGAIAGSLAIGPTLVALAASAGWAFAALALAARIYDSERLLFAPEEAPGLARGWRAWLPARAPRTASSTAGAAARPLEAGEALALFAFCALFLMVIGSELQTMGFAGISASLWVCLAAPVLMFVRWRTGDVVGTLGLARPSGRHLAGAAMIGASGWIVLATAILPIQEALFPTPPELQKAMEGLVGPDAPLLVTLFAIAITPAICEELLCRGVLARALVAPLGRGGAVVVSAILFAGLHLSAYRFVPTFLLGVVLATVALRTRSLWTSMIVHAFNNGAVVLLSVPAALPVMHWTEQNAWIGAPAGAVLLGGFALILRPTDPQR